MQAKIQKNFSLAIFYYSLFITLFIIYESHFGTEAFWHSPILGLWVGTYPQSCPQLSQHLQK